MNRIAARLVIAVSVVLTAVLATAPVASAQSSFEVYNLPTPLSGPCVATVTPGGTAWFVEWRTSRIARMTAGGQLTEYAIPGPSGDPSGLDPYDVLPTTVPCAIAQGSDGDIYFANGVANQIGAVDPATGKITLFRAPDSLFGNVVPFNDITAGRDDAIWFTETTGNSIGRFDLATRTFSSYPIPTAASVPIGIDQGPDGDIWFTEFAANQIGRLDPSTGRITEYPLPSLAAGPFVMRAVTGNRYLWFTETTAGELGRIDTGTGAVASVPLPAGSSPTALCLGSDGDVYYNSPVRNELGRVDPGTFAVTQIPVPDPASLPVELNCGADGSVWTMLDTGNALARYSSSVPEMERTARH